MSATQLNPTLIPEEATSVNTIATQQEIQPQAEVIEPTSQPMSGSNSAYNAYIEIQKQIEQFEKLAEDDQAVAITLPEYPFFTETRLQSLVVHQSGTVSILGEAKGGKRVSVRDQIATLSYALSIMTRPAKSHISGNIEVGFIASV